MVVSCPQCGTKFKIADDKITAAGVKVRCSKCKHTFSVKKDGVEEPVGTQAPKPAKVPPPPSARDRDPASTPLPPPPSSLSAGAIPPPPPPPPVSLKSKPLPPPPAPVGKLPPRVVEAGASDPDDGLPDDIFASPTKVGPPPTDAFAGKLPLPPPPPPPAFSAQPSAETFSLADSFDPVADLSEDSESVPSPAPKGSTKVGPVPSPNMDSAPMGAVPAALPKEVVDQIDLDSNFPLPGPELPAAPADTGGIGDELFADLDAALDQNLTPAAGSVSKPPAPPAAAADPFAGLDPDPGASAGSAAPVELSKGPMDEGPTQKLAGPPPASIPDDPFAGIELSRDDGLGVEQALSAPPALDDPFGDMPLESPSDTAAALTAGDIPLETPADTAADLTAGRVGDVPVSSADDPFADIPLETSADPAAPSAQAAEPAVSSDDPFADIDLTTGAAEPSASAPAASSADIFDGMGDPFAGVDGPASEPPPLPVQEQGKQSEYSAANAGDDLFGSEPSGEAAAPVTASLGDAGDTDPFAALDAGDGGAPSGMDMGVGHDPFSGMGEGGSGLETDDGPDLGPQMAADGSVVGDTSPAGPPPSKKEAQAGASPVVQRPPGPPPMSASVSSVEEPRSSAALGYKIFFGVILVVMGLFVFVVYRHGGKPDLTSWSTYVEAFTGDGADMGVAGDLQAVDITSTAYRNADGHPLVVLWGQVNNRTTDEKDSVVVTGQLLDEKNAVVQEFTAPAGVRFSARDVYAMTDTGAVGDAYRKEYAAKKIAALPAGGQLPFMLVLFEHPAQMDGLRVRVVADTRAEPLQDLPPPTVVPDAIDDEAAADEDGLTPPAIPGPEARKKGPRAVKPLAGKKPPIVTKKRSGDVIKLGPKKPAPTP